MDKDWKDEFGLRLSESTAFVSSKADLESLGTNVSQVHVLRRGFDLLGLNGILCIENVPVVYFKEVNQIKIDEVAWLHRKFWNHGGAPILVLITRDEVQVYSGLVRPTSKSNKHEILGLVEILDRASDTIAEFLPTVQSGEYFRRHAKSFNPEHRVDRDLLDNLQATRDKLLAALGRALEPKVLNALLCRIIFACYLFDRKIIGQTYLQALGLEDASHLRDVLNIKPRGRAKDLLYILFKQLSRDFNGDLFSDDLQAEAQLVSASYIDPLNDFFRATDVVSGQESFWPYDFAAIPVEAISAIYERFLQESDKTEGAFYTPRFLAELVLDIALAKTPSLLSNRYLDPACGSGIFLVGLFNRIAEEWKQQHPNARNDFRARELRKILCENLFGIDINLTACRISAFSLYLAYLDQLSPRDIQQLQENGHRLPKLVNYPDQPNTKVEGNIWCADFFVDNSHFPIDVDLVIGNPPWGGTAKKDTAAAKWCDDPNHRYLIPDKQIAAAFIWKAPQHTRSGGRVCLVLPHGTIFNHGTTALDFQRSLFTRFSVEHVLNLVDYQFFLFPEAEHPAIVIAYRKEAPTNTQASVEYWAPKADRLVMQGEIIAIPPEDRSRITVGDVLLDLAGKDAPQIWKQRFWATARDRRLIDRLSLYPRLRDYVRGPKEKPGKKRWLMAEGVQPLGENDDPEKAKIIILPSKLFIPATSANLDLFLLSDDCLELPSVKYRVRGKSNTSTDVFQGPHVLVAKGFSRVAFADFDVCFRHALRGITGPSEDRDLLVFLTAFLRSPLAKYFLFQTSSNWGVSRQEVHVQELLRLPFPRPESMADSNRAWEIVTTVAEVVTNAAEKAKQDISQRKELLRIADEAIEHLVDEYFDILAIEKTLIKDTLQIIIPSVRPSKTKSVVPTLKPSKPEQKAAYTELLCRTLNSWSTSDHIMVRGQTMSSEKLGIGVAVLQKSLQGHPEFQDSNGPNGVLSALARLRRLTSHQFNMFELVRGAKVFDGDHLYLIKPTGQRFWSQSAALNDADEIAGTLLMYAPQEVA